MAGKISRTDVAELAHALKMKKKNNQSMVLFLGSRAGGLFHNSNFYEIMREYGPPSFSTLSQRERFSECYRLLQQVEGRLGDREVHGILTLSLRDMSISDGNSCVAELVRQGLFNPIVSTNVDFMLEDALREAGMNELHDFDVIIPEHGSISDIMFSDRGLSCKIIKAFGDVAARVYNVTERDFHLDRMSELKDLLGNVLAREVLVVGFDPVWDAEMWRAFPTREGPLWLVTEEEISSRHPLASLARHGRHVRSITGKIGDSEQFLKALYWHLYERMPEDYQLVRHTLRELGAIHRELSKLDTIHGEVQAVYKEILNLQEKITIIGQPER